LELKVVEFDNERAISEGWHMMHGHPYPRPTKSGLYKHSAYSLWRWLHQQAELGSSWHKEIVMSQPWNTAEYDMLVERGVRLHSNGQLQIWGFVPNQYEKRMKSSPLLEKAYIESIKRKFKNGDR
jgi:hypothetical protein